MVPGVGGQDIESLQYRYFYFLSLVAQKNNSNRNNVGAQYFVPTHRRG